jgi:hypothetical protein
LGHQQLVAGVAFQVAPDGSSDAGKVLVDGVAITISAPERTEASRTVELFIRSPKSAVPTINKTNRGNANASSTRAAPESSRDILLPILNILIQLE